MLSLALKISESHRNEQNVIYCNHKIYYRLNILSVLWRRVDSVNYVKNDKIARLTTMDSKNISCICSDFYQQSLKKAR